MGTFILKIKYADTLRRVTLPARSMSNGPDMSYVEVENVIRELFKIPSTSQLVVSYTDRDNDVVTMAGDQDLVDACVIQGLNPLRLTVTLGVSSPSPTPGVSARASASPGVGLPQAIQELRKQIVDSTMNFSSDAAKQTADNFKQILQASELLLKGAPSAAVLEVIDSLHKAFSAQATSDSSAAAFSAFSPFARAHRFSQGPLGMRSSSPPPPTEAPQAGDTTKFAAKMQQDDAENGNRVFHKGVQCDSCGMCPIVGPRFKSMKKHDYDLCLSCFGELGNDTDYNRIDRPLFRPRHLHPSECGSRMMRCPANPSYYGGRPSFSFRGPHGAHGPHGPYGGRPDFRFGGPVSGSGGKLDARFVQDVTIFDGTELAPGTHFTKIWRLRNSGTLPWPKHTQLVHVGGDELGSVYAATLELPEQGLAPEAETEASVDLVAPDKPGRYVSHWRLVAPAGPKFGHRVWVLIQVVPKDEQSPQMMESLVASEELAAENVTDVEVIAPETVAIEVLPEKAKQPETVPLTDAPLVEVDEAGANMVELVEAAAKVQDESEGVETSELGGFSMVEMPSADTMNALSASQSPTQFFEVDELVSVQKATEVEDLGTEEAALDKLEVMGFREKSLNLELLQKNDYDLEQTLRDLIAAAEWDPILEELEEMGFYDKEMNRRLMFKNKGSVKRVVKELVQMYKDPAEKGKKQV